MAIEKAKVISVGTLTWLPNGEVLFGGEWRFSGGSSMFVFGEEPTWAGYTVDELDVLANGKSTRPTDYRALLKKYMAHVIDREGQPFFYLCVGAPMYSGEMVQQQDMDELRVIARELGYNDEVSLNF